MEPTSLNFFSIEEIFWVRIAATHISFGSPLLPKDIHYTVSFHENSPDINFHVTKNIGEVEKNPRIRIAEMNKQLIAETADFFVYKLLSSLYKPFEFQKFVNKNRSRVGYISYESLGDNGTAEFFHKHLIRTFKPITKRQGKSRLKIQKGVPEKLEQLIISKVWRKKLVSKIEPLNSTQLRSRDTGMLISRKNCVQVMRLGNNWYEFSPPQSLKEFLSKMTNERLALKLIWNTKRAVVKLKYATCSEEVEPYNKPTRIVYTKAKNSKAA